MKKRNLSYFRKIRARKIFQRPIDADLKSFLNAALELCKSSVVKRHVKHSLTALEQSAFYKLSV